MSVMKAIYQMNEEANAMKSAGILTDKEIDQFVADFCESHGFSKPDVDRVISRASADVEYEEIAAGEAFN